MLLFSVSYSKIVVTTLCSILYRFFRMCRIWIEIFNCDNFSHKFHLAARGLRCQKSSFLTLQWFLFDFFNLLEFFFILQKKTPFMTIIFRWTIQNLMVDYAMLLLFLIQNLSSLEKLFFYHFFAIVFSWKQLPLKLLFRKLWNWSPETNSSKYSTLWNEFEWNQLKIVYFSLRRKANKFEWKKKQSVWMRAPTIDRILLWPIIMSIFIIQVLCRTYPTVYFI